MAESTRTEHVKGLYLIIVALISLIGGYLLKDPIQDKFFKKYSQIGGVWKPHGDLMLHCDVSTIKDTFFIRMEGTYSSMENWIVQGRGQMDGNSGSFAGTMITGNKKPVSFPIWGHAELAGSDQLGVTVFFDEARTTQPRSYAFVRESSNSLDVQEEKK